MESERNFYHKKKCYKTVKCCLTKILLNSQIINPFIQDRCIAISQMAIKASHLCKVMVEKFLIGEIGNKIEWPDFNQQKFFYQLFTMGCNAGKSSKPTPAIDWTWKNYFQKLFLTQFPPAVIVMKEKETDFESGYLKIYVENFNTIWEGMSS